MNAPQDAHSIIHSITIAAGTVPPRLQTSLKNYLNFFREYCRTVLGEDVRVNIETADDDALNVHIHAGSAAALESVRAELPRYTAHLLSDAVPEIRRELRQHEAELFLVLWKRARADIRTDIRFHFSALSPGEQRALVLVLLRLSLADSSDSEEVREISESSIHAYLDDLHALKMPSEPQELPESLSAPPMVHHRKEPGLGADGVAENPFETRLKLSALLDEFPNDTTKQEAAAVRIILHDLAANITNGADAQHNHMRVRALQTWFEGLSASGARAEALLGEKAESVLQLWKTIDFL